MNKCTCGQIEVSGLDISIVKDYRTTHLFDGKPCFITEAQSATKTPLTDTEESTVDGNKVVPADFARSLELENQELKNLIPCDGTGACGNGKCIACKLLNEQAAHDQTRDQLIQLKAAGEELAKNLYGFAQKVYEHESVKGQLKYPKAQEALTNWQKLTKEKE